jgi:hypothetical protein
MMAPIGPEPGRGDPPARPEDVLRDDSLLDGHTAFRLRLPGRSPLVGRMRQGIYPLAPFVDRLPADRVEPADTDPALWLPAIEQDFARSGLRWDDLLAWVSPLNGFPWLEAIAGCPIHISRASRSAWAGPHPAFRPGDALPYDPDAPWLRALLVATRALAELSAGRFPVAPGIMRGASDILAALLGPSAFCLAVADQPEALARSAASAAELWTDVVKAQYAVIPPFWGGYVNAGLWAAGPCPVYQEDASTLIGARAFERIFGPPMRRVLSAFPAPMLHLHSAGLHILPSVLAANSGTEAGQTGSPSMPLPAAGGVPPGLPPVVEVNIDPSGPDLERLLPIFGRCLAAGPLQLFGTRAQIERCLASLPHAGLACLIAAEEA